MCPEDQGGRRSPTRLYRWAVGAHGQRSPWTAHKLPSTDSCTTTLPGGAQCSGQSTHGKAPALSPRFSSCDSLFLSLCAGWPPTPSSPLHPIRWRFVAFVL